MDSLIILNRLEEEYLVRASESAIGVRKRRQFFLWTQGQVQGLLPHQVLVCIQFGENDEVAEVECVDRQMRNAAFVQFLCHREQGLAVRLARHCRGNRLLPCAIHGGARQGDHPLNQLLQEAQPHGLTDALAHGTEHLRGGATFFVLFGLGQEELARQVYFLELLLPYLHLAFQRVVAAGEFPVLRNEAVDALSPRELEILTWVMRGKSNDEIGQIVHLSKLTIKNHLQKIYKKLNVHNRVQAVARCWSLQAPDAAQPQAPSRPSVAPTAPAVVVRRYRTEESNGMSRTDYD